MYFNPQPKPSRIKLKGIALKRVKEAVIERDGNRCGICRRPAPWGNSFPAHHIQSQGTGGDDDLCNMISACPMCHHLIDLNIVNYPGCRIKFETKQDTKEWLYRRINDIQAGNI